MNNIDSKNVNHRRMVWAYDCGMGVGGVIEWTQTYKQDMVGKYLRKSVHVTRVGIRINALSIS